MTEHGQRLLNHAHHLLAINDEALRQLGGNQFEASLRIGAPHDVAETMLSPLLSEVARASPLLKLDIHVGRSPFLAQSLKRGEIDMTISNRVDPELEGVVLRTSPTVWLCSTSCLHDRKRPIPLVVADGPSIFRRLAHEALDRAGLPWAPRCSSSSLIGIKAVLQAGLGVSARGVEQLDSGLRVLGTGDGMPQLPDLDYCLCVRSHVVSPVTRNIFELLKTRMQLPGQQLPS